MRETGKGRPTGSTTLPRHKEYNKRSSLRSTPSCSSIRLGRPPPVGSGRPKAISLFALLMGKETTSQTEPRGLSGTVGATVRCPRTLGEAIPPTLALTGRKGRGGSLPGVVLGCWFPVPVAWCLGCFLEGGGLGESRCDVGVIRTGAGPCPSWAQGLCSADCSAPSPFENA